ncbi:MAG: FecR domain-containing protein [Bacteroidota bacterium]
MNGKDTYDQLWEYEVPDELIARWLSDDLSADELAELEAQVGKAALADLKRNVEAAQPLAPPKFDAEASWARLEAELEVETTAPAAEPEAEVIAMRTAPARKRGGWVPVIGIAASVAAILLIYFAQSSGGAAGDGWVVVTAEAGSMQTVDLPDGSQVDLRPNATLKYPKEGWTASRKVELAGEAYFKVAKGKTFRVETAAGSVEVLGTRFEVRQSENNFAVDCYSGKVQLADPGAKQTATITSGQSVTLEQGKFSRGTVSGGLPTWAVRDLRYEDVALEAVVAEIEREFDVEIACRNCAGEIYAGSFSNKSLSQALIAVTAPFGLGWQQLPDGSFEIK